MDDYVCGKLSEWGLSELIDRFKEHLIDEESFLDLEEEDIESLIPQVGLRVKFKKRHRKLKKEQNTVVDAPEIVDFSTQCQQEPEEGLDFAEACTSTSVKGKRKSDLQAEDSKLQPPKVRRQRDTSPRSYSEGIILPDVRKIMEYVLQKLQGQQKTKLNDFLNVSACTTVMVKVEANMHNQKYEADIEFMTQEEWKDELWSIYQFLGDGVDQKDDDEYHVEIVEKLSALYGEDWKEIPRDNLIDKKYFREIPEFLSSKKKTLTCESAQELSAKLVKYTRSEREENDVKSWFWPLVKCVTVRVPNNDLLQHVTLVDLPGNGDRNKSRDKMWKGIVRSCSMVWIVTERKRAAAETEAWEILKSASSLMGNGGQCQQIHFICTQSDHVGGCDDNSRAGVRARIFKQNMKAKEKVRDEFRKQPKIKQHFSEDCFQVFTVSAQEFLNGKYLSPDESEIPKLQDVLRILNDCHSETLNYVSGAHGILSLMEGASCREVAGKKADVCADLERNIQQKLGQVKEAVEKAYVAFEKCLDEGVEKSRSSCDKTLKCFLYDKKHGSSFHRTLKSVVENRGVYKPKKGKTINLNLKLTSFLTDSIDEEFRKTFPNEAKCEPFHGAISAFTLGTEGLIQKYTDVKLQLTFLKTEEEKIKTKLTKIIRDRKKTIYNSLQETIESSMRECYERAAAFRGQDTLKNMRETIEKHVRDSKDTMFEQAKDTMLKKLNDLKVEILETLDETMKQSIELSLKTDDNRIPEVSTELVMVKKHYDALKHRDEKTD